jgi:hypothetical protein
MGRGRRLVKADEGCTAVGPEVPEKCPDAAPARARVEDAEVREAGITAGKKQRGPPELLFASTGLLKLSNGL